MIDGFSEIHRSTGMALSRRRLLTLGAGSLLAARRPDLAVAHDMAAARDPAAAHGVARAHEPAAAATAAAEGALNPNTLERYVDALPIPSIARPVQRRPSPGVRSS
jgi:hypothetical protein